MLSPAVDLEARRGAHPPLHSIPLGQCWGWIYADAGHVNLALWQETFGGRLKDFAYYRLLDQTLATDFAFRYLVLGLPNENPFALQPLILLDQDLSIGFDPRLRAKIRLIRRYLPRFLRARMMLAGCLTGEGHLGVTSKVNRRKAAAILAQALIRYADAENISLITLKDFPAAERSELQPLLNAGFTRLDGYASLKLKLDFASFEEYLRERLSRTTRKNLGRKFRRASTKAPFLTFEVRDDCRAIIDEIYPLYLAVAQRSAVQFEVFTREYFIEASLTMSGRCRFFVWRNRGRAVAFSYCTVWGDTIYDHDLGLDYFFAHELSLYYVSFRDIIVWALQNGYCTYRSAPFGYDPKLHLRLALEPVDLFVRHRPLLNLLLRYFAPRFSPSSCDPLLRRHCSAAS
ncbi:MAG TPA: GNAT family N-acetyltransferase [Chthoniobacterales bacterium]|jgi:hypothetical protein